MKMIFAKTFAWTFLFAMNKLFTKPHASTRLEAIIQFNLILASAIIISTLNLSGLIGHAIHPESIRKREFGVKLPTSVKYHTDCQHNQLKTRVRRHERSLKIIHAPLNFWHRDLWSHEQRPLETWMDRGSWRKCTSDLCPLNRPIVP